MREHQLIPTITEGAQIVASLPDSYVRDYFPTASSLIDLWRVPHSSRYLRFAAHACLRVERAIGIDVLDTPGRTLARGR